MEVLLASTLLSLSTNIDNLAVGMAYGMRHLTIGILANLTIALLSGISTFVSMSAGDWIGQLLPENLVQLCGSGVLIAIGVLAIGEIVQSPEDRQAEQLHHNGSDRDRLSWQKALILGLALTLTNFGTGVGAGIAQLDIHLTSICSFLSSLLTIGGGAWLGRILTSQLSKHWLQLLSGILLIGLGTYEYFGV